MKWKLKVLVQFVLAHVPGGEQVNHRLQLAGGRHSPARMRERITKAVEFLARIEPPLDLAGRTVVEVGTGWDGLHPILLSVLGARRVVTFDHMRHLRFEHARLVVRELAEHPDLGVLETMHPGAADSLADLLAASDLDDLLGRARITYAAPGDATESGLDAGSVDVVYSFQVFEHLPVPVIEGLLREARRILAPGGLMISAIDPGDHYRTVDPALSRVHFLRYPEWLWAPLVKNRISYHNRLRERQFLDHFARAGATVGWKRSTVFDDDIAQARTMRVDRRFAGFTPEELAVSRTELVVTFE